MGLFDIVSKLTAGSTPGLGGNLALMQNVLQMLATDTPGGGLSSIVKGFEHQGLGNLVSSWVGTGQNLPISPEQLQRGLGSDRVRQLAQAAGVTEGKAASALSSLLPVVVDRLTPNGAVPHTDQLEQLVASLTTDMGFSRHGSNS